MASHTEFLTVPKAGIIVDAEGTRANRLAEIAITETMIERVKSRFDLRPRRLAGDTVYGAVRLLKWLVDRGIHAAHSRVGQVGALRWHFQSKRFRFPP
jgi:hypothetical protein